jgi:multiple sugar transport system substrate-binding protein
VSSSVRSPTHAPAQQQQQSDLPTLNLLWFDWGPCRILRDALVQTYDAAVVNVTCVFILDWKTDVFHALRLGSSSEYDVVILDSQWIGLGAANDLLMDITEFVDTLDIQDYFQGPFDSYGEYPPNSKRYFGIPLVTDVMLLTYRKDVFDAIEVDDVFTLEKLVETSRRITDNDTLPTRYGYTSLWCADPTTCFEDEVATVWNQMAWSFGGALWDSTTFRIDGILQSDENVRSLELAKRLLETGPPNAINDSYGHPVARICRGEVAMITTWAAWVQTLDDRDCPFRDRLQFTVHPGQDQHFLSLGGMGMHVPSKVSPARQSAALDFFRWFQTPETQRQWTRLGGFPARKSIMASGLFLNARQYSPVFGVSYPLVRDFWNIPEYRTLLEIQTRYLGYALTGVLSAREALERTAAEQQAIIDQNYPDGPPLPPMHLVEVADAALAAMLSMVGVTMACVLACMAAVFALRHVAVFRFAQPIFLQVMLFGLLMMLGALLTYARTPATTVSCNFHLWMVCAGLGVVLGPLLSKTLRVLRIWRASMQLMRLRITNGDCAKVMLLVFFPLLLLLVVWTAVDTNQAVQVANTPELGERVIRCSNDNLAIYVALLVSYFGLLIISMSVVAFLSRHTATEFNESRYIALLCYNTVVIGALVIPLIFFVSDDPTVRFAFEVAGVLFFALLFVALLFGSKFYTYFKGKGGRLPHVGAIDNTIEGTTSLFGTSVVPQQ